MPVRKTESRIPTGLTPSDMGEAVVAPDGRCALVSFITSPLAVNRENVYVVFVTDAGLAAAAHIFEWTFTENGEAPNLQTTDTGQVSYTPASTGTLDVALRILDGSNSEQASLALTQDSVSLNPVLENLISSADEESGPGVANPDVVRELVNDCSSYYQAASLQATGDADAFRHFLFSIVFDGALQRTPAERRQRADELAVALNNLTGDLPDLLSSGLGICAVRLPLLAMTTTGAGGPTPLIDWTELPDVPNKRDVAEEQLCQAVGQLEENTLIDLLNVARFPKSNISSCAHILTTLRDRYFNGTNFTDVLTGMSGTRAHWIVRHYREGPLATV